MYIDIHSHHPVNTAEILSVYNVDLNHDSEIPNSPFTIGLHPWWINDIPLEKVEKLQLEAISNPHFVGLGEIGLDRAIKTSFDDQMDVCLKQFNLAVHHKLSVVIIHCVRSFSDIISLAKKAHYHGQLIFHDYNGDLETTRQLLKQNVYFSLGQCLYRPESKGHKSAPEIPLDRLFLETDDNQERSIIDVYKQYVNVCGMDLDILQSQLKSNFESVFHKKI